MRSAKIRTSFSASSHRIPSLDRAKVGANASYSADGTVGPTLWVRADGYPSERLRRPSAEDWRERGYPSGITRNYSFVIDKIVSKPRWRFRIVGAMEHFPLETHPAFPEQRAIERFSPAARSTSFTENSRSMRPIPPKRPFFDSIIPVRSNRLDTFRSMGSGMPVSRETVSSVRNPGRSERCLTRIRAYSEEADILNMAGEITKGCLPRLSGSSSNAVRLLPERSKRFSDRKFLRARFGRAC